MIFIFFIKKIKVFALTLTLSIKLPPSRSLRIVVVPHACVIADFFMNQYFLELYLVYFEIVTAFERMFKREVL